MSLIFSFLPLALSGCAARYSPAWLPGVNMENGEVAALHRPHEKFGILCCHDELGGFPINSREIKSWQELDGKAVPLVDHNAAPECSKSARLELDRESNEYSGRPVCEAHDHFPAAFTLGACSMGINPLTLDIEFSKCCARGKFGTVGTSSRTDASSGQIDYFFFNQRDCEAMKCPTVQQKCQFPATMYDPATQKCIKFMPNASWVVHNKKECGWRTSDYSLGSYDFVAQCIRACEQNSVCQSIEVYMGQETSCVVRSEMCSKPASTRLPIYTLSPKTLASHRFASTSSFSIGIIGIVFFSGLGILILCVGILCLYSSSRKKQV